jgi:hypothetical protein
MGLQAIAGNCASGGDALGQTIGDLEAYNLYLKAYHLAKFSPASLAKSKQCFEQALSIARLCSGMGRRCHLYLLGFWESCPQSSKCTQPPGRTQPSNWIYMSPAILVILAAEYAWQEAEREFRRAIELGLRFRMSGGIQHLPYPHGSPG